ncbi:hypothetical protein [Providencia sp. PROV024]|nr:hypothetical protein [Providencia sp. PROV024]WOC02901.1 hypothetical protein P3L56_13900 [Providencia sp. PROV024]
MSDKKEIATLSIKISVDSTDLDKLEAQLKRIEGLMVSVGLKQPAKGGFVSEPYFGINNGQVFINEALITSGTMASAKIQGPAIDDAVGTLDKINEAFHNSGNKAFIAALEKSIDINIPVSHDELKKHKQYVKAGLDEMQSQLIEFKHTLVANEQSTAQHLSGLQRQLAQLNKELEEARCKESINNTSIISLKQTIEQQEKLMIQTIKGVIAEDVARGGPLCRALR